MHGSGGWGTGNVQDVYSQVTLNEQAIAMLMLDLKRAEERANTEV